MKEKKYRHGGTARKQAKQLAILLGINTNYSGWVEILAKKTGIPYATWRDWVSPKTDRISGGGLSCIRKSSAVKKKGIKEGQWHQEPDSTETQKSANKESTNPLDPVVQQRAAGRIIAEIEMRGAKKEWFMPKYAGAARQTIDHYLKNGRVPWEHLDKIIEGLNKEGEKRGLPNITRNYILYGSDEPQETAKESRAIEEALKKATGELREIWMLDEKEFYNTWADITGALRYLRSQKKPDML